MTTKKQSLTGKLIELVSTDRFFSTIVGLFIVQALWIALFSKYPMAFDEGYHYGVIKLYGEHLSPFWSGQPAGANEFGAIFRDPSYLYHYILSFPYRLISLVTSSLAAQVIFLRLISIALFVWGLFIYKRLLHAMGASKSLSNILIFIFTLIPVTSMLAGQINYDNLLIPITGLLMLWTVNFISELRSKKTLNPWLLHKIVALGLFGALVKYAFLPFFASASIIIFAYILVSYRKRFKDFIRDFKTELQKVSFIKRWLVLVIILLLSFLATERYGLNYIRYQAFVPDCSQAMSVSQCSEFGPWIRDHNLASRQINVDMPGPFSYLQHDWLYGMWFRLFFALAGPTNNYQTKGPLTAPAWTFIALFIVGGLAVILYGFRVLAQNTYRVAIPLGLSLFYVLILFANGYASFSETGKPVAINGRYLLPVLLPIMAFGGIALVRLVRSDHVKVALAILALVGMLAGGGVMTYILRSESSWYWTSSLIINVNSIVHDAFGPVTPGYDRATQYLH